MRTVSVLLLVLIGLAACAGGEPVEEVVTITFPETTTTEAGPTTTGLASCDLLSFVPTVLPERVGEERPEAGRVAIDRFTALPGTSQLVWTDPDGEPVVVLVRGSLPPERWSDDPLRIAVRGGEGALGPLSEGIWAVAWFEGPDRCDEYTLVLYPPTGPEEARRVADSLVDVPDG